MDSGSVKSASSLNLLNPVAFLPASVSYLYLSYEVCGCLVNPFQGWYLALSPARSLICRKGATGDDSSGAIILGDNRRQVQGCRVIINP